MNNIDTEKLLQNGWPAYGFGLGVCLMSGSCGLLLLPSACSALILASRQGRAIPLPSSIKNVRIIGNRFKTMNYVEKVMMVAAGILPFGLVGVAACTSWWTVPVGVVGFLGGLALEKSNKALREAMQPKVITV